MISKIYRRILRYYAWCLFGKKVEVFGFFKVGSNKKIKIGNNCRINTGVYILGQDDVQIGNNVILSANSMIIDSGIKLDDFLSDKINKNHIKSFVHIEDNVWIGAGAIVLPGITIGKNSIVAAGSVVTKDVEPYTIVAGNPAKILKRLAK